MTLGGLFVTELYIKRNHIFLFLSFGALLAAAYHVLGAISLLPNDQTPTIRHLIFVLIDILLCLYFHFRPRLALPLYIGFCIQQTITHGQRTIEYWQSGRFDYLSVLVLVTLYTGLVFLIKGEETVKPKDDF